MNKTARFLFAAALSLPLPIGPSLAQWQTPNHSVPIGKGSGVTGFGSAVPATAGRPLISNGAAADPSFGTIANSGFTPGAANTVKGTLDGVNVADLPLPSCTAVNSAYRYASGVGINCSPITIQTGYDMPINFGMSSSAAGGALTLTVTQSGGSAPTSNAPVLVPFRSTSASLGTTVWGTISASTSLTIPSGATMGAVNSVPFRVWVFLNYNNGTPALGVATCSNATQIFPCASWESTLKTSITLDTGGDNAGVLYAGTGVTLDAVRIVGFCEYPTGLATAGTWSAACTTLQPFGPGVYKPGQTVQTVDATTTSTQAVSSTTKVATALASSVSLTSPVNPVRVYAYGWASTGSSANGTGVVATLYRQTGTVAVGNSTIIGANGSNTATGSIADYGYDAPAATNWPATQYGLYIATTTGANTWTFLGTNSGAGVGQGASMKIEEIQG